MLPSGAAAIARQDGRLSNIDLLKDHLARLTEFLASN
jgi:hypothetical protein